VGLHGGATAAKARLHHFIAHGLPRYHQQRLNALVDGTSRLSPYLHFGQISPLEVARAAQEAAGDDIPAEAIEAFLDELITQRELAINFCLRNPHYDAYTGLPDWGKRTLERHRDDPRPAYYSRLEIETAQTHDRIWNACQRQMVAEGWLPNALRMYWAKRLLYWTQTPEEAYEIAVEMNDRFFVDGRDANGYAQIAWAIGGRHDRPFPPEKPVIGLIRPMGLGALRKRFDVDAYIAGVERRLGSM
jgi:deoxyribodipyrimidine photo-lyase